MFRFSWPRVLVAAFLTAALSGIPAAGPAAEGETVLFNGKSLDGWTAVLAKHVGNHSPNPSETEDNGPARGHIDFTIFQLGMLHPAGHEPSEACQYRSQRETDRSDSGPE